MFKRLRSTGEVADVNAKPSDTPDKIVRSAILVHSGPNGKRMTLSSSDGDITFNELRIKNVIKNHNAMVTKLALQYGGFDKMPAGSWPPILDQHADDSANRVLGRLTGLLRFEKRKVPKVGNDVACAVCDVTFLGRDTVDKVKDGRYYHLSVGIDESTDTLGETSVVIEPAAPGAMVLNKRKLKLQRTKRMSQKSLAKLEAIKNELKTLSKKTVETKKRVHLAKRKKEVSNHLTKLMSEKKMSPAEFKKIDLTRLAKLDKQSFDDVMHVYDAREALISSGQQGSNRAANFSDVGVNSEEREYKRLKAQAKKNLEKQGVKFLAKDDEDEDKKDLALDETEDKKEFADDGMSDETTESSDDESAQDIEEIAQQCEENATQIARVASMVETIVDQLDKGDDAEAEEDEKDEADEDESEESDDKKDLEDKDDKDKKDLEEKKDDKKEESN